MFEIFLSDENAQGAIEYILLAGGIIVAGIIVFSIYSSMTRTTAQKLNQSTSVKADQMANSINAQNLEL